MELKTPSKIQHILWVATEGLKFYILLGAAFLGIAFIAEIAGYLTQGR